MKVLVYGPPKIGGISLRIYGHYLVSELNKIGIDAEFSDKIRYRGFDIINIHFEHTLFHPFGLRIIPKLIKLKLKGKKIVLTSHTVLAKKEIYARNKLFTLIKKIILPITEKSLGYLCDKIVVHAVNSKRDLIEDYKIPANKVEALDRGFY